MLKELIKTKEWIIDLLMPKKCLGCGREGLYICRDCEIFLSEVENKTSGLTSIWEYEGLMKKLIWQIKHNGCHHIINELMEKAVEKMALNLPQDVVIAYVPVFTKKEKKLGFNPAERIAKELGRMVGRRVEPLLVKLKDNRQQDELPPELRFDNVAGTFFFKGCPPPEKVLLVDDYYVTGATANECSKVLKQGGVKDVWVFTLACQLRG